MCVRTSSSPRSIAGVPSGWALQSFPITAHHLCVSGPSSIDALAVCQQNTMKKKKLTNHKNLRALVPPPPFIELLEFLEQFVLV